MNKIKELKKELKKKDKEWALVVRKRFNNQCVICGNTKFLNSHHIIPREIKETRHDIRNGVLLCVKHHKFGIFSFHRNALWGINVFRECNPYDYFYLVRKLNEMKDNPIPFGSNKNALGE